MRVTMCLCLPLVQALARLYLTAGKTWVLRGHHGDKPENIMPFKWKGLGNYSGPTTLYSLAKKQDPAWTSKLPHELRFRAAGSAVGYDEVDPLVSFDQVLVHNTETMDNVIELEPLPDAQQVRRRGRPKRTNDDAAKERENDVEKVKEILSDLRKNELTGSIEYTDNAGKTVVLQGNDLDLMTTRLACENGVFIPEPRIKSAIQYAAQKNQYCPIRRYLDHCASHALPHPNWDNIGEVFLGNRHSIATLRHATHDDWCSSSCIQPRLLYVLATHSCGCTGCR